MSASGADEHNGRVTIRDLYEAIQKQDEKRVDMERRIMDRLDILPALQEQTKANKEEIDRLRSRSDIVDMIVGLAAAVGAVISGWLGTRQ